MTKPLIEICLENAESVITAEKGGADRVELCSSLFEGGLSPSLGTLITAKRHTHIPISVMVRPRGGDFCYSDIEYQPTHGASPGVCDGLTAPSVSNRPG